jgi:ribosomal protein S18 acetylase RimI-like enzyme
MREYARALSTGFDRFFASYGNDQVHLWLLTTDPDFRRRGAGTMLCNWGLQEAKKRGFMLTVLASPMGKLLYEHLGYKQVGTEKVQAKGEDYTFDVYCLEQNTSK